MLKNNSNTSGTSFPTVTVLTLMVVSVEPLTSRLPSR